MLAQICVVLQCTVLLRNWCNWKIKFSLWVVFYPDQFLSLISPYSHVNTSASTKRVKYRNKAYQPGKRQSCFSWSQCFFMSAPKCLSNQCLQVKLFGDYVAAARVVLLPDSLVLSFSLWHSQLPFLFFLSRKWILFCQLCSLSCLWRSQTNIRAGVRERTGMWAGSRRSSNSLFRGTWLTGFLEFL